MATVKAFELDPEKVNVPGGASVRYADAGELGLQEGDVNVGEEGVVHRALGGTIGTGLFVGVGSALASGGPLGVLLGYTIMGGVVGSMMIALGELTTAYPVSGAFTHYAARFVDPALGFALGWNYWYSWGITIPTEISAASLVINYWQGGADVNPAVWISVFLVVITSFNFIGVRAFGEAEFWFSIIKIVTIIGLILLGIIITAGGAGSDPIGFRYWRNPGPFQQENGIPGSLGRFLSFWTVFVQAAFSFLGTEIVALTAGEAENPRRNVPKAIKKVFYRIAIFYIGSVFVIGLLVSPNDPQLLNGSGTSASPWTIAITRAGIKGLPSVINVVVLISAFSAGNSDLYAASRTLYGLACDGKAPAIFRRCTKGGLPIYALGVTALFGFLAYIRLTVATKVSVGTSSSKVFTWLSNLGSITGLIAWDCILLSYLRFYYGMKRQGISRSTLPYIAPMQPYASFFGLIFITIVIFFNGYTVFLSGGWSTADFVVDYVTLPIFAVMFVFWKLFKKTKLVSLESMDFDTGRRELELVSEQDELNFVEPTTFWAKLWDAVM
ncbi:hypothetical protein P7C70_g5076, partial [Phenoliferia sp. Uapishka_3]